MSDLIKLSDDERKSFGAYVCKMIRSAMDTQVGDIKEVWSEIGKAMRGQPIGGLVETPGVPPRSLPLIQPRADQFVTSVCGPSTNVRPYYVANAYGPDTGRATEVADGVHFLFNLGKWDRRFRQGVRVALGAEPSIYKIEMEVGESDYESSEVTVSAPFVGPKITVIHPEDFAIYPVTSQNITDAILVGDRYYVALQDILADKELYPESKEVTGGDDPQTVAIARDPDWSGTVEGSGYVEKSHEPVECFDCLVKHSFKGDKRKWYQVRVAMSGDKLLMCKPFAASREYEEEVGVFDEYERPVYGEDGQPLTELVQRSETVDYPRPWYFAQTLQEPEQKEFYRATPIARKALDIQRSFSGIWNLLEGGALHQAFPAGFTTARLPDGLLRYGAGTIHQVDDVGEWMWVDVKFNPGALPMVVEKLESMADSAFKISQAGIAKGFKSGTTATEAGGILAAQNQGLDEYRANANHVGCEIADYLRAIAFIHFDDIRDFYGDAFPVKDREMLRRPLLWEPNGKGGQNMPDQLLAKLQLLMDKAPSLGLNQEYLRDTFLGALDLPVDLEKLKSAETQPVGMDGGAGVPVIPGMDGAKSGTQPEAMPNVMPGY